MIWFNRFILPNTCSRRIDFGSTLTLFSTQEWLHYRNTSTFWIGTWKRWYIAYLIYIKTKTSPKLPCLFMKSLYLPLNINRFETGGFLKKTSHLMAIRLVSWEWPLYNGDIGIVREDQRFARGQAFWQLLQFQIWVRLLLKVWGFSNEKQIAG